VGGRSPEEKGGEAYEYVRSIDVCRGVRDFSRSNTHRKAKEQVAHPFPRELLALNLGKPLTAASCKVGMLAHPYFYYILFYTYIIRHKSRNFK